MSDMPRPSTRGVGRMAAPKSSNRVIKLPPYQVLRSFGAQSTCPTAFHRPDSNRTSDCRCVRAWVPLSPRDRLGLNISKGGICRRRKPLA
jgi:hypothetical protein